MYMMVKNKRIINHFRRFFSYGSAEKLMNCACNLGISFYYMTANAQWELTCGSRTKKCYFHTNKFH